MEGDAEAPVRRHLQHLFQRGLIVGGGLVVVVHAPGDVFTEAVESQQTLASAHGQIFCQALEIGQLAARRGRAEIVADAQSQLVLARQSLHGVIGLER